MNFKVFLILITAASCAFAQAETAEELKQKIKKLESQIQAGADPALVKPYLEKFKAQLAEKQAAKPPVVKKKAPPKIAKQANKPKAKKKRPSKKERDLEFLKTTSVEDRIDRYSQLAAMIHDSKQKLVKIKQSGRTWQQMKSEVRTVQDALVNYQKEFDLLAESLGPLRAIAAVPMEEEMSSGSGAPSSMKAASDVMKKLDFKGHMQYRHENQNATGYAQNFGAKEAVNLFRLRGDFVYHANDRVKIGFSPQAVKSLGGDENLPPSTSASSTDNTLTETSGSTNNTAVDFYEAYVDYKFTDFLSVKLGRQMMAYGDHIVIGSLPWANEARSFDALRLSLNTGGIKTDLFASQVSDAGTTSENDDDDNFYGLYTQFGKMSIFNEFDLYALRRDDDGAGTEVNTFGFRFKGVQSGFFYRLESAAQTGLIQGSALDDGYQVDTDIGYVSKAFDFKLGFSQAGIDYIQLFPTAHAFLGFADIFGRRNIMSYRATTAWKSNFGFSAHIFYHQFSRVNDEVVPYGLTLGKHTNNGNSDEKDLGSEVDIVLKQKFLKTSQIHLGAALFSPGDYFKDQPEEDADQGREFIYVQIITRF